MSIVFQARGIQHCRNIKKDALTYWYLFGGSAKTLNECIKMALEDHVKLCQEEAALMSRESEAPTPVSGEPDPF
jgi:hypothetical protein